MKQYMDVFSIPEMTLLAAANDFFISNDIEYDPVHLYRDVSVSAFCVAYCASYLWPSCQSSVELEDAAHVAKSCKSA